MTAETTESQDTNTEQETTEDSSHESTQETQETESKEPQIPQAKSKDDKEQEILDRAKEKLEKGEITHDKLPEWIQKKVVDPNEFPQTPPEKERDAIKNDIRDEMEFEKMAKEIPTDATDEQMEVLNEVFNKEWGNGENSKSRVEAMEYAMFKAGMGTQLREGIEKGIKIGRQAIIPNDSFVKQKETKTKEQKLEDEFMQTLPKGFQPTK